MGNSLKIKALHTTSIMFGLVFLLLISPCKVRNYLQTHLDIPQTNVLNKSQSAVGQSDCVAFEISKSTPADFKHFSKTFDAFSTESFWLTFIDSPDESTANLATSKTMLATQIPLYILYQNFQFYS